MTTITAIHAREILDSRGNPTIEADVWVDHEMHGRFSVPSGASTGEYEAVELRDKDSKRFFGKGVQGAVAHVNRDIAKTLIGSDVRFQEAIDDKLKELDGTLNKSHLGANALLAVSGACVRAAACCAKQPLYEYLGGGKGVTLPVPMMNVINGGAHADNGLDFQEFMIVPHGLSRFSEALRAGAEIFHTLKIILKDKGLSTSVGDEGGFAPHLETNERALALLCEAIERAGYKLGTEVSVALDIAASEFYDREKQVYRLRDKGEMRSLDLVLYYAELVQRYPIVSIEDALDQNDWEGFAQLTKQIGKRVQVVGDDLFVTNQTKLERAIDQSVANAILIKPNQIGTITETLATIALAQSAHYGVILSHRSGETEDTSIADIAVATNAGQIKTGSLSRTDRVAKYNQLLRIEEELKSRARYAGSLVYGER